MICNTCGKEIGNTATEVVIHTEECPNPTLEKMMDAKLKTTFDNFNKLKREAAEVMEVWDNMGDDCDCGSCGDYYFGIWCKKLDPAMDKLREALEEK